MPLNTKTIAVTAAVIFFFLSAFIGLAAGLSTFTCCKRAVIAAIIGYATTTIAVKLLNSVLITTLVDEQLDQQEESVNGR